MYTHQMRPGSSCEVRQYRRRRTSLAVQLNSHLLNLIILLYQHLIHLRAGSLVPESCSYDTLLREYAFVELRIAVIHFQS